MISPSSRAPKASPVTSKRLPGAQALTAANIMGPVVTKLRPASSPAIHLA